MLWQGLRVRVLGRKFRRQHAIGDFVLDFYCAEAYLAVEVDGSVHEQQHEYHERRDQRLARHGIWVMRVSAREVWKDLAEVL